MSKRVKKASRVGVVVREILKYLVILTLCVVLGVNAFLANAAKTGGDAMPMPFGVGISVVLSGSMEPTISTGDLLVAVEQDSYRLGDIVVYQSGSMAVVHRIVAIDGDAVTTKGDANNAADEPIQRKQIRGKAVLILPELGYAFRFLQTLPGILILIVLVIFLLELSFRKKQKRDEQDMDRIKDEIRRLKKELEETSKQ